MRRTLTLALLAAAALLGGCETAYYSAMEKVLGTKTTVLQDGQM